MKFLVILAILVGILPHATLAQSSTTPTFVQSQDASINSGDTLSVTFPTPNTSGNLIVAYVLWSNTDSVTLSDSQNNVYQSGVGPTVWRADAANAQVLYASSVAGGPNTVTATFASPIAAFGILYAHEYAGLDQANPIDAATAAVGVSDTLDSGTLTTSTANDLLFSAGGSSDAITALAGPFVARSTTAGNLTADATVSSAGQYDVRANHTGTDWVMQLVALRGAGGVEQALPTSTAAPTAAPAPSSTPTPMPGPTQTPAPAVQASPARRHLRPTGYFRSNSAPIIATWWIRTTRRSCSSATPRRR